ncbi:biotin-dependent carboxyltransferase family protein [Wielerella bovis]|uniref:5-oxoprolinase subunit C family protein n=1 Tax=Wielerella bovis TaxID=2917790 RepID=UPI002019C613|nr:biotin-dependent carboxyltransferase family protein [Wielerella bovis]ULJ62181.1 biotin-dependent carboxyltransferase family protein [Wielerella bovis]
MLEILECATLASVQDLGRYGLRRLGIGHAGAMDTLALKAGNLLLQNEENAAAIEVALGSISMRFERDTPFCLTGAVYQADLDGESVHSYWRYTARAGQTLRLIRAVHGMYGYVCVHGGLDVAEVLGARSTDLKAAFGGHQGRNLKAGDRIALGDSACEMQRIGIAPIPFTNRIHALPSSEYTAFTRNAHYRFWQNPWTLQSDSNRMGYRFGGSVLNKVKEIEMLSHAVQFGTVQVPPSGQPIVLMADTQTTGGYPKIATVVAADLGHLAQIRFGSKVFFQIATPQEAAKLKRHNEAYLHQIGVIAKKK